MINLNSLIKTILLISFHLIALLGIPSSALAHDSVPSSQIKAKNKQTTIELSVLKILTNKGKKTVFIKLTDRKTKQPIRLQDLAEVHTQRIHMLVIDDSLKDYSHVHPKEASEPGVYYFFWQPLKQKAIYRIWADLVPLNTQQQEYVIADLYKSKHSRTEIIPELSMEALVDGYQFKLSFEQAKLIKGKALRGKITVNDLAGSPVNYLEPVMGAYAHIVGFADDFNTVIHIHPMGKEPQNSSDRGGPVLDFHIEPQKAGFIKLFAQVKIKDKELFVPFGVLVQDDRES